MCYFQREVSSECKVWPHILLGGLCWLTGLSSQYGTDMISFQWPLLCLSLCLPLLHHSSLSLSSLNCICIMLFVFAEITDPGTEPQLRCIKKCSAYSQCSWLNTSWICCLSNGSVLHNNICSVHPYAEFCYNMYSEAGMQREVNEYFPPSFFLLPLCTLITCKIPEVGSC